MKSKFHSIYQHLIRDIHEGRYMPGDTLPSEHELTTQFEASRETIRKALKQLSEHGYIQKIQGKGSVVLDVQRLDFPVSGVTSFQELNQKLGMNASTAVVAFNELKATAEQAHAFQLPEEENLLEIARVRMIDGERIILDKDWFPKALVPGLTADICAGSIYAYIENTLELTISFAKKEIVVDVATEEDVELLDVEPGSHIVVVHSLTYLEDATLLQITESRHRPDRFRFVEFARRHKA
ncbi:MULTISPECIES: trehalose operon repressor [Shouchella]|uniref:Trehalose operon repressor n=2 Tax=Shouchella TaxID=2893057 RepID=A0A060LR43_9BACI|nr:MULTISPECIES: trehalose operon repressor [Shouchella]AIC93756.1 trehalose transcription repressor [Shouchella lehensis G1]RQW21983.1 trehalose operon repressor [Bacillus sp. C1-1]WDF02671.1 trehalose operon repressor [Shouchella hunanensis]